MIKLALVFAGTSLLGTWLGAATYNGACLTLCQEKPGIQLRVASENRTVEVTGQTSVTTVEKDNVRYVFTKDANGALNLLTTRDGQSDERKFDSEAALKDADAELFALYEGKTVKVFAESAPAEHTETGNRPDYRGGIENMQKFQERLEKFLRASEALEKAVHDPALYADLEKGIKTMREGFEDIREGQVNGNGENGLMAEGDLGDADTKRLSREARERLDRDLKRLEERDRDNAKESDPTDKAETGDGITQDRYLASLRALERTLLDRVSALKNGTKGETTKSIDDLAGKVKDTYADLRDKLLDDSKKTWGKTLETGREFFDEYSTQLDGWSKKIGTETNAANPYDDMRDAERKLLKRVKALRKPGGDKYSDILDEYEDKVKDTYADMFDKLKDDGTASWKMVGEMHVKFSAQMNADLDKLEKQISIRNDLERPEHPEEPKEPTDKPDWKDTESPERDVKLPPGEQADIIGGVRVARLTPLVRKQLGLDNGLSVNEIVNADGILAEAGLEVYDIIIEINGDKVDTRAALRDAVTALKTGEDLKLTIMRDGKKQTLKVKR